MTVSEVIWRQIRVVSAADVHVLIQLQGDMQQAEVSAEKEQYIHCEAAIDAAHKAADSEMQNKTYTPTVH